MSTALLGLVLLVAGAQAGSDGSNASQLTGTWRGTSTCTDRVAAPACKDETVVYEFSAGSRGSVHWKADKIVAGKREPMGELDLTYDAAEACWKAEFSGPSVKTVWRLVASGDQLTGSGRLVPGNQVVRRIEVRRDRARAGRQ